MPITFTAATRLLFIGDSITDCGRKTDADSLGSGYVRRIRDCLAAKDPVSLPIIINRGVSGNKVTDLAARWERDVLAEKPDVLSVMIGINDVWHSMTPDRSGVPLDLYVATYRTLLSQVRSQLSACKLILCEPTVIWAPQDASLNPKLKPYVQAVGELAREFKADHLVPLHSTFENAHAARADIDWATDGVHPTSAGHMLIARTWLSTTNLL